MNNNLTEKLNGLLLPATTPFDSKGEVDFEALRSNIFAWSTTGITGIVFLGSTGERVHLNEREYLRLIEAGRGATSNDLAYIVGAGQQSTIRTIDEVHLAAHAGADAVLVITPHFYRSAITQQVLFDYYTAVADASPVPVMLYSMPALTTIKLEPETIARLSSHSNIIGVKDSSNDVSGFEETVKICPPHFTIMTGNGTVFLDALKAGATGGILAVGCVAPDVCVEVFRAFREGRVEVADNLQAKLTPLAAAVTTRFGIGGLKAALDLAGYRGGAVRAPLQSPTEDQRAEIVELFKELKETFAQQNSVGTSV